MPTSRQLHNRAVQQGVECDTPASERSLAGIPVVCLLSDDVNPNSLGLGFLQISLDYDHFRESNPVDRRWSKVPAAVSVPRA